MNGQLWVEVVGDLIIARVRGEPTEALLRECHEQVLVLVKDESAIVQGVPKALISVRASSRPLEPSASSDGL